MTSRILVWIEIGRLSSAACVSEKQSNGTITKRERTVEAVLFEQLPHSGSLRNYIIGVIQVTLFTLSLNKGSSWAERQHSTMFDLFFGGWGGGARQEGDH